jgi:RHS repeat-associated protein
MHNEPISGWQLWSKNPRGYTTTYEYDKLGRIIRITEPKEETALDYPITRIQYGDSPADLFTEVLDPLNRKTTYRFNDLGQLKALAKYGYNPDTSAYSELSLVRLTYNRWGEVASLTDANGYTTLYGYDAMGRRNKITYPDHTASFSDNPVRTMDYDYETDVLTIINEEGDRHEEHYDLSNRLLKQVTYQTQLTGEVREIVTGHFYDGLGNEVVSLGPKPDTMTIHSYNSLNQIANTKLPAESFFENGAELTANTLLMYEYDRAGFKVREMVSAPGDEYRLAEYLLDGLGRQTGVKQLARQADGTEEELSRVLNYFDANGNIVKMVDANYARLTEAERKGVTFTYTVRDKVRTQTDLAGHVTSYTYYIDGSTKSVTGPRGNSGQYPPADFTLTYHYDDLNRIVCADLPPKGADSGPVTISFDYDARGNLLKRVEADGSETSYTYHPRNWVESETVRGDEAFYTVSYQYDRTGNVVETTDRRGKQTNKRYNELGQLITIQYPAGNKTLFAYDEAGAQTVVIDGVGDGETGKRTEYAYDKYNRLRKVWSPEVLAQGREPARFDYDRLGNRTREINVLGHSRAYAYDRLNRLVTETDELGFNYTFTYDKVGNMLTSRDANGTVATYEYTANYLLRKLSLGNEATGETKLIEYTYDAEGFKQQVKDDEVISAYNNYSETDNAAYTPDAYGRIISEELTVNGKTFRTAYEYDLMDRVTAIAYPHSERVSYSYNKLGELIGMPGYLSAASAPRYEGGLLKELVIANNTTASFSYDGNGRLSSLSYEGSEPLKEYSFTYDASSNIVRRNEDLFSYDLENRLATAYLKGSYSINGREEEQKTGKVHEDLFGKRALEFSEGEGNGILSLDYAAGSIGVDLGKEYELIKLELFPATPDNRVKPEDVRLFLSSTNYPGDYSEVYDFTARYAEEEGKKHLEILLHNSYKARYVKVKTNFDERDNAFNPVDRAEFKGRAKNLFKVHYKVREREEVYRYDLLGNRLQTDVTMRQKTGVALCHYYPGSSRLLANDNWAYSYDANGSIIEKGNTVLIEGVPVSVKEVPVSYWRDVTAITFASEGEGVLYWQYEYDLLNRLVAVCKNGRPVAEYTYSWNGYRVGKTHIADPLKSGDADKTTYYIFSPSGKLLYEQSPSLAAGEPSDYIQYIYAFNRHLAVKEGKVTSDNTVTGVPATYFLHTDHLGSVVAVTNAAGAKVWDNDYTPFGELSDESKDNKWARFSGKQLDKDIGLIYMNARWYDASIGRFVSLDPLRAGVNWYVYCSNSPISRIDPSGLIDLLSWIRIWDIGQPIGIMDTAESANELMPHLQRAIDVLERIGSVAVPEMRPIDKLAEAITGKESVFCIPIPGREGLTTGERIGRVIDVLTAGVSEVGLDAIDYMKELLGDGEVHHWINQGAAGHDILKVASGLGIDFKKEDWNLLPLEGHSGGHTREYYDKVQMLLTEVKSEYDNSGKKWSEEELREALKGVRDDIIDLVINDQLNVYNNQDANKSIKDTLKELDNIYSDAEKASEGSEGSESGDKIICVELYRQGLMDKDIYRADERFGATMKREKVEVLIGYQFWAKPVVGLMKKSKAFTDFVNFFAKPWSYEMAHRMGERKEGDFFGSVLMSIGIPICGFIGKIILGEINGLLLLFTASTACLTLLFLRLMRVYKKRMLKCLVNSVNISLNGKNSL